MVVLDRIIVLLLVKVIIVLGIASKSRQQTQHLQPRPSVSNPRYTLHSALNYTVEMTGTAERPLLSASVQRSTAQSQRSARGAGSVEALLDPGNESIQQLVQFSNGILLVVDGTSVSSLRQTSEQEAV